MLRYIFLGLIFFTLGAVSDFGFYKNNIIREDDLVEHVKDGNYTNPLLACGDIDGLSVGVMEKIKKNVEEIIKNRTRAGQISHASVYVRDLNNGPWMGINEKELFYPASLLKVPLLLSAYKVEEEKPGFLDQKVVFEKKVFGDLNQIFPPKESIKVGQTYSLRDLLKYMIVYSDNEATSVLATHIGPEPALEVFSDFGIEKPKADEGYQTRVRTYASFFRVLYNASYLSRKHSEEALNLLSQVDFKDALVAGIPKGVPVAHKFGEREGIENTGDIQLHDCGIVYTNNPYLVCVMAQGKNTDGIINTINLVSKEIYQLINGE